MDNVFDEFKTRGLVYDATEGARDLLGREKIKVYIGFDPTADSMHVGNLIPMMQLARFQRFGHTPIALAGGATGMIGDPSGKSAERNLLTPDVIAHNVECIKTQLASVLDFDLKSNPAMIVNNADWLGKLNTIDYLRDVGKHFTVQVMMGRESVKNRLSRDSGLSYTEFSYMLLQAYDFLHLYDTHGVMMQCGGSDQWGNITAGSTLIRKVRQNPAQVLVYPLLLRPDGTKFGKTAEGESVWLDPNRTSPYRFYQFFVNSDDSKVIDLLNTYTFLPHTEIAELAQQVEAEPHKRAAQKRLAQEVTRMVHGETALANAEKATAVLFGGDLDGLDAADINDIFANVPSSEFAKSQLEDGMSLIDLLADAGVTSSKGEARRDIKGGAINLNNQRVTDVDRRVILKDAIEGQYIVLRKGRKKYHLIRII